MQPTIEPRRHRGLIAAALCLPARGHGRRRLARGRRFRAAACGGPRSDRCHTAALVPGQDRQQRRGHPLPGRGPRDRVPGHRRAAFPALTRRRSTATFVAWSITLARPSRKDSATTTNEVGFFNEFLGTPSEARIGVLRPVPDTKPPQYKLVSQSPLEVLNPYFGSTVIFALDHPLTVLRGQVVALTIPTWAPMFAFNVAEENTWRGSRLPKHCASKEDIQNGHPSRGSARSRPTAATTRTHGCSTRRRSSRNPDAC